MTESIIVVAAVVVVYAIFIFMAMKAERIVKKQAEEQLLAVETKTKSPKEKSRK